MASNAPSQEDSPRCTVLAKFKNDKKPPAGLLLARELTVEQAKELADSMVKEQRPPLQFCV